MVPVRWGGREPMPLWDDVTATRDAWRRGRCWDHTGRLRERRLIMASRGNGASGISGSDGGIRSSPLAARTRAGLAEMLPSHLVDVDWMAEDVL